MPAQFSNLLSQNIGNPALGSGLANKTGVTFIQGLIPALINMAFVAGSVIFLANLFIGGMKWISAGGDKGKLEEARQQVTQAIVGVGMLLLAYAIISFVEFFFGVDLTMFDLESLRITGSEGGGTTAPCVNLPGRPCPEPPPRL